MPAKGIMNSIRGKKESKEPAAMSAELATTVIGLKSTVTGVIVSAVREASGTEEDTNEGRWWVVRNQMVPRILLDQGQSPCGEVRLWSNAGWRPVYGEGTTSGRGGPYTDRITGRVKTMHCGAAAVLSSNQQ